MTTTYDSILAHCASTAPALIYVSIGCAGNTNQQNPPFLDTQWPDEHKVLVLIDPALEDTVVASEGHRTVFALRDLFHWPSVWNRDIAGPHVAFLAALFALASARTQVVLQDFTGEDIHQYFTRPGPDFDHRRILFDATYGIGGCTPDMKSAFVLRARNGGYPCARRIFNYPVGPWKLNCVTVRRHWATMHIDTITCARVPRSPESGVQRLLLHLV